MPNMTPRAAVNAAKHEEYKSSRSSVLSHSTSTIPFVPTKPDAVASDQSWNSRLYRTSIEVDTRSAPTIEWVLLRESVPKNSMAVLVVTVWVSDSGVVDHFELEDQQPNGDWAAAVLSSLQTTVMEPATLGGVPVASTMTIEITLDNNTP
jgi:hypothetical protein